MFFHGPSRSVTGVRGPSVTISRSPTARDAASFNRARDSRQRCDSSLLAGEVASFALEEFFVRAAVVVDVGAETGALRAELDDPRRELIHQVTVVADEDDGPFEQLQAV